MLVDSHCHLDFPELAADADAVVARARAAGIGTMVTIGTELARFAGVLAMAKNLDDRPLPAVVLWGRIVQRLCSRKIVCHHYTPIMLKAALSLSIAVALGAGADQARS